MAGAGVRAVHGGVHARRGPGAPARAPGGLRPGGCPRASRVEAGEGFAGRKRLTRFCLAARSRFPLFSTTPIASLPTRGRNAFASGCCSALRAFPAASKITASPGGPVGAQERLGVSCNLPNVRSTGKRAMNFGSRKSPTLGGSRPRKAASSQTLAFVRPQQPLGPDRFPLRAESKVCVLPKGLRSHDLPLDEESRPCVGKSSCEGV